MQDDENLVAVGGAQYRQSGCLLAPFIPVRAAGTLVVTTSRVIFDPILHYKLVTRKFHVDLSEVGEADVTGSDVQLSVWELVSLGKTLTLKLRNGATYSFRSMQADELAQAINGLIRRHRG